MSWIVVWGTRPELTKLHSVVTALRDRYSTVQVWCTNQHSDLITATADSPALAAMVKESLNLRVFGDAEPEVFALHVANAVADRLSKITTPVFGVIVQGDTGSAYGAAMGAHRTGIPVAHVEAGVRSGDPRDPYPEEHFRVAIDRIARWHFASTQHCAENLFREGHSEDTVKVTGNTGIDALWHDFAPRAPSDRHPYVLITLHRRERWPMVGEIADALDRVAAARRERFRWPVHPNPVLKLATAGLKNIRTSPPLGHLAFREALWHAKLCITDSGGVQEEAAAVGTPCLVVRKTTDRPESVVAGHAAVVGTDPDVVAAKVWEELEKPTLSTQPFAGYGDGQAGQAIATYLTGRSKRTTPR